VVEGVILNARPPASEPNHPAYKDFARTVKENITVPLINASLTPEPSLEAFIPDVVAIKRRLNNARLNTIREVQVELKLAGRVSLF
jgi:hypothetical protein